MGGRAGHIPWSLGADFTLWDTMWKLEKHGGQRRLLVGTSQQTHLSPFSGLGAGFDFLYTYQKARSEVSENSVTLQ